MPSSSKPGKGPEPIPPPDNPPAYRFSSDLPRLKMLAFQAIGSAGDRGADPAEIAAACLGAERVPEAVAKALVESLLARDRRVANTAEGRYVLRDLLRVGEGTPILEVPFCVVDVETTGVSTGSRIIEVGAVQVQSLINVDVPLPPEITTLTGITADMLASAPDPGAVLESFCSFLGDAVFCAHSAPFDRRFVFREVEHFCLRTLNNPVLCTKLLARRAMPEEKSFSLDALSARFGLVNEMRHRGLGDARVAAEILITAVERLMERGVQTLEDLLRIQRKPEYLKFLKKVREDSGS
ncbi:MAG: 3'-5' exonuclease [Planctomycetota bacterium]